MTSGPTLVTGAAGFIGSHLVRSLLSRGEDVHVILRPTTDLTRIEDLRGKLKTHVLDLRDPARVAECITAIKPAKVFHLAAQTRLQEPSPFDDVRETISGYLTPTINLVEALSRLENPPEIVVRAGTIAEYGNGPVPFLESQREQPVTAYGAGMAATTNYLQMLRPALGFPVITARLALVYGPGQSEKFLVASMLRGCLEGKTTTINRPRDRRGLIYIDDVVDGLNFLADKAPRNCGIVNIGTGKAPTMRELAQVVLAQTGANPELVEFRDQKVDERPWVLFNSIEKARQLGWQAQTSLAEGLAKFAARCVQHAGSTLRS